ncbi:hypothetical protein AV530_013301 [Patagioenas fasciata monilis]|uniref:Uncharacterized protein n=1 Tax=Patagioenas fasciata monilis TaxID=372326 RepID=A0A1V4JNY3_PATFA|nr:hypothetical protein AV530_013301 [Patagioenas fasciata monilis]
MTPCIHMKVPVLSIDRSWSLQRREPGQPGQNQPWEWQSVLHAPRALAETQHLVFPQEQPLLPALLSGGKEFTCE